MLISIVVNYMSLNQLSFSVYDCFTQERFGGNVGVIVWNAESLSTEQMQKVAREFNAPVTGYVTSNKNNLVSARFFMPNSEIAMCGHVTIGMFTDLVKNESKTYNSFTLDVNAGKIEVNVDKKNKTLPLVMFKLNLPIPVKIDLDILSIAKALQVDLKDICPLTPIGVFDTGLKHLFVNFLNKKQIIDISPNYDELKNICTMYGIQTIACFAFESSKHLKVIKIRDFCPSLGVNETPASGTTNGALAAYLLANKLIESKTQRIIANQGIEIGRPSKIITEIEIDAGQIKNLKVGGSAIENFFGKINI